MNAKDIESIYQDGVDSTTVAGREEYFNRALAELGENTNPSGQYFFDLGNSYYQIQEYPWAIFYYVKAQRKLPRSDEIASNLASAQAQLEIPVQSYRSWIPLSVTEELMIAQTFILVTTLLLSLRIWFHDRFLVPLSNGFAAATLCLLLFIIGQHYLTPVDGVLAKAAILYKQPATESDRVFLDPLPPGTVLQVIGEGDREGWLKVTKDNGFVGYIQADKLLL
jgi:tetratricopeptide (TPR) repeat protein